MSRPNNLFFPICAVLGRQFLFRFTGLLLVLAGLSVAPPASAQTTNKQAQIDALNSELNDAMEQVQKIVNQPVTRYVRQPGMNVSTFSPGWFHPGANTPDFNNVDVRTTQEKMYDQHGYVSSDLNPGVAFLGRELEFNSNTKYFYTDRSLPKKKLTEPEMLEINRLYRIIGHCQHQLAQLQNPEPTPETTSESTAETIVIRFPMLKSTAVRVTLVTLALLGIVYLLRRRSE
jgi:hypothetical protein